jgi:hypothetical protein
LATRRRTREVRVIPWAALGLLASCAAPSPPPAPTRIIIEETKEVVVTKYVVVHEHPVHQALITALNKAVQAERPLVVHPPNAAVVATVDTLDQAEQAACAPVLSSAKATPAQIIQCDAAITRLMAFEKAAKAKLK